MEACCHTLLVLIFGWETWVLMWETIVHSSSNIPKLSDELNEWLTNAHDITDDWFFKLIEGNLLERFK